MERKTLGCKRPACGWDSPAIDIQGCQLRHGACDSLRRGSLVMTLPAASLPSLPSPGLCQPLSLSMSHMAYRPCLFRKIFFFLSHFPWKLKIATTTKKKKKGPPSLLAFKTMLGQGQGSGHHVGNKKRGSQESLNRVLTGNFVMNRRSAHCVNVGRFGWVFFFSPWLCVFAFSNLEGGLPRS